MALKRAVCVSVNHFYNSLLGAGVLGDSLGSLTDGVLGQFSGKEETDSGLDLPTGDGGPLVVMGETGGLGSDSLKDVVDKAVHDGHGFAGHTSVGVNLFQHLVDVNAVGFLPPPFPFLVNITAGLCLGRSLLSSFRSNLFRCHLTTTTSACRMITNPPPFHLLYHRPPR